jgi:hypothetical protein
MRDIYKEFGVDVLRDSENAGPSAAEMKMAREIERLRARVEALEKVRAAAQALINEDAGVDDPAEDGWWDWEKNCEALRAALKEAKP